MPVSGGVVGGGGDLSPDAAGDHGFDRSAHTGELAAADFTVSKIRTDSGVSGPPRSSAGLLIFEVHQQVGARPVEGPAPLDSADLRGQSQMPTGGSAPRR